MNYITRPIRKTIPLFTILVVALSLSSCGLFGGKEQPPLKEIPIKPAPAKAQINFLVTASPLINPQPNGQPSPVVLRLYQLKGQAPFIKANFRQLWENGTKTLGPTLLGKTEFIIQPGGVKRIMMPLVKGTLLVAVAAGFRDFQHAKWRAIVALHGRKHLKLKAVLKTHSVTLGAQH